MSVYLERHTSPNHPTIRTNGRFGGVAAAITGMGWILVTAIQYAGAYNRANSLMNPDSAIDWLDSLDLTPWYVVLLAATILIAAIRFVVREPHAPANPPDEEIGGGTLTSG